MSAVALDVKTFDFSKLGPGDVIVASVGNDKFPPNPQMLANAEKYFQQIAQATPAIRDAMLRGTRMIVIPYYLALEIAKDAKPD